MSYGVTGPPSMSYGVTGPPSMSYGVTGRQQDGTACQQEKLFTGGNGGNRVSKNTLFVLSRFTCKIARREEGGFQNETSIARMKRISVDRSTGAKATDYQRMRRHLNKRSAVPSKATPT